MKVAGHQLDPGREFSLLIPASKEATNDSLLTIDLDKSEVIPVNLPSIR